MSQSKVSFEGWELESSVLSPTRSRLESHSLLISSQTTDDPLVTFSFPSSFDRTLTIHRCLLLATDGPLHALVSAPFVESQTNTVVCHDSFETIFVLRRFLYCLPVDLSQAPCDLALVAQKWQCDLLVEACMAWAEMHISHDIPRLVEIWMAYFCLLDPPSRFSFFFTRQIATNFHAFLTLFDPKNPQCGAQNIWHVFHQRGMLQHLVHNVVRFSSSDHSLTLLNIVMFHLEPLLSDAEITELLLQFDWNSSSCITALSSPETDEWSRRAWRLLALTPTPPRHSSGTDLRMQWRRAAFGYDSMNLPVCSTSDEYDFCGLSFSFTFQAWCWAQPVSVSIKLNNHSSPSKLQHFANMRVSACVSAMEDQCCCGLRLPSSRGYEEYEGRLMPCIEDNLTVSSFAKKGGVEFLLMDPIQFAKWRRRHDQCGLLICARLRVYSDESSVKERNLPSLRSCRDDVGVPWQINCPCAECRVRQSGNGKRGHTSTVSRLQVQL